MTLDLTADEARALATHLRRTIDGDRFPLAPRLDPLKAILAKLDPPLISGQWTVPGTCTSPKLKAEPLPPLTPGERPRVARRRQRG